jgi:hypothetical protein
MPGIDIPTAKLAGALLHPRLVPRDELAIYLMANDDIYIFDQDDPWLARLAYAARAHHGVKMTSDKIVMIKFKPEFRLKPMS